MESENLFMFVVIFLLLILIGVSGMVGVSVLEIGDNNSVGTIIHGVEKISDNDGIDASTNSLLTIEYAHHEIHAGTHFFIKNYYTLGNSEELEFLAVPSDTLAWSHMFTSFNFELEGMVYIYENTTTSNDGTPITSQNRNRNSNNTAKLIVYAIPTVTIDGNLVAAYSVGAGKKSGGESRANNELILKQNTKYLIKIVNGVTTANNVDYLADWYEHTDKN